MAKKGKKKAATSEKALKEYRAERAKKLSELRSLEKRGYIVDIARGMIPDIPERISAKDVRELKKITLHDLYRASSFVNPKTHEIMSAYKGRELERKVAGYKGVLTQAGKGNASDTATRKATRFLRKNYEPPKKEKKKENKKEEKHETKHDIVRTDHKYTVYIYNRSENDDITGNPPCIIVDDDTAEIMENWVFDEKAGYKLFNDKGQQIFSGNYRWEFTYTELPDEARKSLDNFKEDINYKEPADTDWPSPVDEPSKDDNDFYEPDSDQDKPNPVDEPSQEDNDIYDPDSDNDAVKAFNDLQDAIDNFEGYGKNEKSQALHDYNNAQAGDVLTEALKYRTEEEVGRSIAKNAGLVFAIVSTIQQSYSDGDISAGLAELADILFGVYD